MSASFASTPAKHVGDIMKKIRKGTQLKLTNPKNAGHPAIHDIGIRHIKRAKIRKPTPLHLTIKLIRAAIQNKIILNQAGTDADWDNISCGGNHSLAIKTDGSLWTWGKNQFGQFDYITFPKAKYEDFEVSENTFQPQLGTWEASALEIAQYSTLRKRYYVDTQQSLTVNTDWIDESYNEWFKQMLVSDEVYQVTPVPNTGNYELVPLVIKTKNIRFKTFVNDKLINYTIEFTLGRSYKLIL